MPYRLKFQRKISDTNNQRCKLFFFFFFGRRNNLLAFHLLQKCSCSLNFTIVWRKYLFSIWTKIRGVFLLYFFACGKNAITIESNDFRWNSFHASTAYSCFTKIQIAPLVPVIVHNAVLHPNSCADGCYDGCVSFFFIFQFLSLPLWLSQISIQFV